MTTSMHIDNKNKGILILDKGPTQGLDNNTLTAEAKYAINFTQPIKIFVLSMHYNGSNSFLFANATKNISVQIKRLWKKIRSLCRQYFKIFYN